MASQDAKYAIVPQALALARFSAKMPKPWSDRECQLMQAIGLLAQAVIYLNGEPVKVEWVAERNA